MDRSDYSFENDENEVRYCNEFSFEIDDVYPQAVSPAEIFADLTRELQKKYAITKGVLIMREPAGTRYIAVATMARHQELRKLSLLLPTKSSLFEIAAEDGNIYTENYFGLFSGNTFEKNLLLDKSTESFMLHPVKCEGRVVAVIGYSSDVTDAFVTFDNRLLANVCEQFGRRIVLSYHQPH